MAPKVKSAGDLGRAGMELSLETACRPREPAIRRRQGENELSK